MSLDNRQWASTGHGALSVCGWQARSWRVHPCTRWLTEPCCAATRAACAVLQQQPCLTALLTPLAGLPGLVAPAGVIWRRLYDPDMGQPLLPVLAPVTILTLAAAALGITYQMQTHYGVWVALFGEPCCPPHGRSLPL